MSDKGDSTAEKTEDPTEKKLQDSKKNGQTARSKELTTFAMLAAFTIALYSLSTVLWEWFSEPMRLLFNLNNVSEAIATEDATLILKAAKPTFYIALFSATTMCIVAIASTVMFGGFIFSMKAASPNFGKINPIKGIARMFSVNSLMELLKSIAKFSVFAGSASYLLYLSIDDFVLSTLDEFEVSVKYLANETLVFLIIISFTFIAVAALDAPFQLVQFKKQLKMSKQEIKDESKETEGNPEIKQRVKSAQREIANRRSVSSVPQADVIVVNPSHFSVALSFNQEKSNAPILIGKGLNYTALEMRTIANSHKIPVISSPVLARSIYYNVEMNQEIPRPLYIAVSTIYRFIMNLDAAYKRKTIVDKEIQNLSVPTEFYRD